MHIATSVLKRLDTVTSTLPQKDSIFISCFPKTASTFLREVFALGAEMRIAEDGVTGFWHEQDLYEPFILDHRQKRHISRLHMRATEVNIELMQKYDIRPVVLVRNLYDTMVSLWNHSNNESHYFPHALLPEHYTELSDDEQLDMLVDLSTPWFLGYFYSWKKAESDGHIAPYWLTFEEFISNKTDTVLAICEAFDVSVNPENVRKAVEELDRRKREFRFNKGKKGRGKKTLSQKQIDRIQSLAAHYQDTDFSMIGL